MKKVEEEAAARVPPAPEPDEKDQDDAPLLPATETAGTLPCGDSDEAAWNAAEDVF